MSEEKLDRILDQFSEEELEEYFQEKKEQKKAAYKGSNEDYTKSRLKKIAKKQKGVKVARICGYCAQIIPDINMKEVKN